MRPLAFRHPQNSRRDRRYDTRESRSGTDIQFDLLLDYVTGVTTKGFERIAVYTNQGVSTLTMERERCMFKGESVSADCFRARVQPVLG